MATFETLWQCKENRIGGAAGPTFVAGAELSLWEYEGAPSHGAVPPTTYANPNNTTQGALPMTNPAAGKQKWIHSACSAGAGLAAAASCMFALYDRLLHKSGFDGTVTTAQNVNGGSDATPDRVYVDSFGQQHVGNEIWLEIYTSIGSTPTTVTCSYKNELGASKTTQATTFGGARFNGATRFIKLPLAAGDRGVSAVVSVTLAASTGTAGDFGIVVARPLVTIMSGPGGCGSFAGTTDGPIEVMSGACLAWYLMTVAQVGAVGLPLMPANTITFVEA